MLCSARKFAPWYITIELKKRDVEDSTREDSGEDGSKIDEGENVKSRPAYAIENAALHYICGVGKYQKTTATKRVKYMYVVQMAIQFRWSGASCIKLLVHGK